MKRIHRVKISRYSTRLHRYDLRADKRLLRLMEGKNKV